jgi:hypothetical protein
VDSDFTAEKSAKYRFGAAKVGEKDELDGNKIAVTPKL